LRAIADEGPGPSADVSLASRNLSPAANFPREYGVL
jgi:hypothetical protein